MEERDNLDQDPAWRKGRYRNWSQIERVLIKVNGEPVMIPDSAFEGIYGVRFIIVKRLNGAIRLQVTGGDAGESYFAFFTLKASKRMKGRYQVAERVWRLGEFPEEVRERTTYYNSNWDNPSM